MQARKIKLPAKPVFVLLLSLFISLLGSGCSYFSGSEAENARALVRFRITAVGESGDQRRILSETIVEGLPGTDFNVNLKTEKFSMQARFLSDLTASGSLNIRTKLNARRFAGVSERNLPLFEEDVQNHTFKVTADETIVLLPFGNNTDAETLKFEVTSAISEAAKDAESRDNFPRINIVKPYPNGEISVEAFKIPHRFAIQAILTADGDEIARASRDVLLEDAQEIILQPNEKTQNSVPPLKVELTVDSFRQNRASDLVGITFKAYESNDGEPDRVILNGKGIAVPGKEIKYNLDSAAAADNRKYELKFIVNLADGEKAD